MSYDKYWTSISFDNPVSLDWECDAVVKDDVELEDTGVNLSLLAYDVEPVVSVELSPVLSVDKLMGLLTKTPALVQGLSNGITSAKLSVLGDTLGVDLVNLYASKNGVNVLLNAIAKGFLVSKGFEGVIDNPRKIFYVTASLLDSVHFHDHGDYQTYRNLPAISLWNRVEVNGASSLLGSLPRGVDLWGYLKAECYTPVIQEDVSPYAYLLALDNLALARSVSKSKSVSASLGKLSRLGCESVRLNKIAMLVKSIKDCDD